jgi:hypothetical protein
MKPVVLIFLAALLLIPGLILYAGKKRGEKETREEIDRLRALAMDVSTKTYRETQITGLPDPVQRYFRHVLKEGQPYISSVFLKHDGQFKTSLDKEWIDIEGEQYFTADEPGFLWLGKTSLFTARDMFIAGKGRIVVSLLSLFKVVDGRGEAYDQGELLRWLGESVWFPTNLLPSHNLQWVPLDENSAGLLFYHQGMSLYYTVRFNQRGEITELETRRCMGEERLATWVGRVSDYEEAGGMKIPMKIEAFWRLEDGDHSYARFTVRKIHHD